MARLIALGAKTQVQFRGGPFDRRTGYLHSPESGTLEFTCNGMKGHYYHFIDNILVWSPANG